MLYLYETHMHTCQASACGRSTGAEQARFYREIGYTGIIVTDHFFGGNCAVPRELPWPERVDLFCAGYEDALAEGQKIGLDVFFAWEQNYEGDEYLIYGPDKAWLLAHPDVEHWSRRRQLEEIHRAGGAVIQAHPFRKRDYIKYIQLGLKYCDGIEVANTGNLSWQDVYAARYADAYELFTTAGSDNHHAAAADPAQLMAMASDTRLSSAADYAHRIRARSGVWPVMPAGRLDVAPDACPKVDVYWIDEANPDYHRVPVHFDWLPD